MPRRRSAWGRLARGPGQAAGGPQHAVHLDPGGPQRRLRPRQRATTSRVAPGATKVVLDAQGPRRHHAHVVHVPRPGAASLGQRRLGQPPGDAAADLLRRPRPAGRRGPAGRLLRQLLRQAERGDQRAGRGRGRRFVQLLLADAVPQVDPHRDRQPEREADQPALLQHRLDQEGLAARGHAVLLRPVSPGVSGRTGQGLRDSRHRGQGALRRHGAVRPHPQPVVVRRGRREDLHRRRGEGVDLGHRHRGLLPLGLGTEDDQHAVLRHALLRPVGHRRRTHQRLPLARPRPDRLQRSRSR